MQNRIIEKSKELFLRHGYSKIRIDEIAAALNISKKTIYNHFGGKEELLFAVIDSLQLEFDNEKSAIINNKSLVYEEEVKAILSLLGLWVSRLYYLVNDLKISLPGAFEKIVEIKKSTLVNNGIHLLNRGVELDKLKPGWHLNMSLYMFIATSEKLFVESFRETLPSEITNGFPLSPEERLKSIVEIIYSGITK